MVPTEPAAPSGITQVPSTPDQSVLATLTCRVDVAANSINCAPASPAPVAGRSSDLILGGQNIYVTLANTLPVNNGTTITASLTVLNRTVQPWGTTDGTTPQGTGVRVFFLTPPTSPVTVNAPFTGFFTAPNQQYFQYSGTDLGGDGILSPQETSLGQTWIFTLNGAPTFTFQLLISTAMPAEQGVLRFAPALGVAGGTYFNAVWGNAANDVWAAGQAGTLSHWTGSAWSSVASGTAGDINSIWGSSGSDIYAVGSAGEVQRYNGSTWTSAGTSGGANYGVWGSSASDVWIVGLAGQVWHTIGDGTYPTWTTNLSSPPTFAAVWGTGPLNVYAVGGNRVARYDGSSGTSWSYVDISAALLGGEDFRTIWGSSATDIWVAGANGVLLHFTGGAWTRQSLGSAIITGLWGTSANDVYATNEAGDVFHYNGTSWVAMPNTGVILAAVWASGTRDMWAVGTNNYTTNAVVHGTR
ncbi:MAG: hypothetical protein ABIP93_11455 [Gemmatimonadaceae bacterium]